jgi:hypothetical protein
MLPQDMSKCLTFGSTVRQHFLILKASRKSRDFQNRYDGYWRHYNSPNIPWRSYVQPTFSFNSKRWGCFSQASHKFSRHLDCHNLIDQSSEVNRTGVQYSCAILWTKAIPFQVPGLWQIPQDALRLRKAVKIYSQFRYEATSSFVWDSCVIEIHVIQTGSQTRKKMARHIHSLP